MPSALYLQSNTFSPFYKETKQEVYSEQSPPCRVTNNGQNTKIQQDNILLTQNEVRLLQMCPLVFLQMFRGQCLAL